MTSRIWVLLSHDLQWGCELQPSGGGMSGFSTLVPTIFTFLALCILELISKSSAQLCLRGVRSHLLEGRATSSIWNSSSVWGKFLFSRLYLLNNLFTLAWIPIYLFDTLGYLLIFVFDISFWNLFLSFDGFLIFFGIARCFEFILYISWSISQTMHFSKNSWFNFFIIFENGIRIKIWVLCVLETTGTSLLPGLFRGRARKCMYM